MLSEAKSRLASGRKSKLITGILSALCAFVVSLSPVFAFESEPPPIVKKAQFESVKDGAWSDQNTWDPIGVPDTGDTATIKHAVTINGPGTTKCGNITVNAGKSLTIVGPATLEIDDGSQVVNNGTFTVNSAGGLAKLTSGGTASFSGSAATWAGNNLAFTKFSYPFALDTTGVTFSEIGTLTTGAFTVGSAVTLSGNLASSGLITVSANLNIGLNTLTAGAGITITASTLSVASGGTINCNGGSFGFTANSTARLTLAPGSKVYLNPSADGQYGFNLVDGGQISATGTAGNLVTIASSTAYKTYILLKNTATAGTPAALFQYCDITGCGVSVTDKWGITAYDVNGNNDSGVAAQGLTVDNCQIHNGSAWAVVLNTITGGCLNNRITNNTMYSLSTGGIYIGPNTTGNNGHLIGGNTIYSSNYGMQFVGANVAGSYCFSTNPITNTTIYSCAYGLFIDRGICGGSYTNEQIFRNCNFGTLGQNTTADIGFFYWAGRTIPNALRLENCILASPVEVETANIHVANDRIVSYKHDSVPGLVRAWGDWRPLGVAGQVKARYDTALVAGVTNDANTQKIVEFGPCSTTMAAIGTLPYQIPAGKSRLRIDPSQNGGALIEFVGITTPSWAPVLVRSTGADTYGILIEGGANPNQGKFSVYAVEFQNLVTGTLISSTGSIPNETTNNLPSLDYCTWKNNTAGTTHLVLAVGGNITRTGCSFDTSTTWDVRVDNTTNITFTNFTNSRANTADNEVSGTVTWSGGGTTYYAVANGAWNNAFTWDITPGGGGGFGPPTINDNVVITNVTVTISSAPGTVSCTNLTVSNTGILIFNPLAAARSLIIKNGGIISNTATIDFQSNTNPVTITAESLTNPNRVIYKGNDLTWLAGLNLTFAGMDYQRAMNPSTNVNITFSNSMQTQTVTIINGSTLKLDGSGTAITWTAAGDVAIGSAATTGLLELQPETALKIQCASNGQYGLIVDSLGTLTATGTSTADRDCIITSASSFRSYIYLKPGSLSKFQYCNIYELGYAQGSPYTKEGIFVDAVKNQANDGFTVDGCDIHNNYQGIRASNITSTSIANSKIYNNSSRGIYFYSPNWDARSANNNISNTEIYNNPTGIEIVIDSSISIYNNTKVYNNTYGLIVRSVDPLTFDGGSIYGNTYGIEIQEWSSSDNFINVQFGTPVVNSVCDVNLNPGTTPTSNRINYFRNCLFNSATEFRWANPANVHVGFAAVSYKHDQVAGDIRIWGDYVKSAGTENWNYTNHGYTPVAPDAGQANTPKVVTFMPGASGLNGGTSRFRLDAAATLDMASGNTTPVNITSVKSSVAGVYYNMILSGTINANCYKFENLGYDAANSNYGLEIRSTAAQITSLNNGIYANCKADGQHLYFNNTAFGGNKTISGCSFDNSAWYDVWTNIGAAQYITFTNYSNDYAGTKDFEEQGYADWFTAGAWITVKDGNWHDGSTWNNASVPPDWNDVTINHTVNVTGTVKTGNIAINAGGLGLNGGPQAMTLQVLAGMTITNNASISVTDDTNTVELTSSGAGAPDYFILAGNNSLNLNGKDLTIGLVQVGTPITVPNLSVLTIDNDLRTITTTISDGGELKHQTAGKEWSATGNISVSGILRLGANTLTRINSLSSDGQYGLEVESTGYLEALGTSSASRDCIISNGGPGSYKLYLLLKNGSESKFQYATLCYIGTATDSNKRGIRASSVDGNVAGEGLTVDTCNIYGCYFAFYLSSCTYNTVKNNNIYDNSRGISVDGTTNNNTIDNNYVYSNTDNGVSFGWAGVNQTFTNMWISKNPVGISVGNGTPATTAYAVFINSVITNSSTADVVSYGGYVGAQRLTLQNCILGSTTEVQNTIDKTGDWVISQKHDQAAGTTVIWGDYSPAAGATLKFNYADESYTGAGDQNVQKTVLIGPSSIVAFGNRSRLQIPATSVLQMKGGVGLAQATLVSATAAAGYFYVIGVSGTIDANNVKISGPAVGGIYVPSTGTLADFNNITFTNPSPINVNYLKVFSGQQKTLSGISFDDNTSSKDVEVGWNGITPTQLTFIDYTNTNAGTKDLETDGSQAIWKSTIALFNGATQIPGTIYQGDANVPMLKFNIAPSLPAGVVCSETLLTYVAVTLTGAGAFSDSDISAVKIYRDTDGSNNFDATKDLLISNPVSFTNWYVNIQLIPAQNVLTANNNTFFVVYDISKTANLVPIGARLVDNNYFTVSAPHDKAAMATLSSGNTVLTVVDWKSDLQLRKDPAGGWTGNDIYTMDGQNQSIISNTDNAKVASYYIRIQNDGGSLGDFSVTGDAGLAGQWWVTYYSTISGDITSSITGPGILLNLAAGATWDFAVGVEPQGQATASSKELKIWSRPKNDATTTLQDLVKFTTYVYPNRADLAVKAQGGSYSTDDTFDPPAEQKLSATINKNTLVTYYVQLQNDGTGNDQITVTGTSSATLGTGWTVKYYDSGNTDITTNITNGLGWLSPVLTSTGTTEIRVEATATDTAVAGIYTITVGGKCYNDATKTDQVKIALTINSTYRSDVMVKKSSEADGFYLTDNTYETIPAAQIKNTSIDIGGITSYYIKLQNDGNVTDNFTITGTNAAFGQSGPAATWWVTYYYGTVDITSDVTSNKWLSPPVTVGGNIVLTAYIYNQLGASGSAKEDYLTAISYNDSAKKDAVKMITSCGQLYQPDLMVSKDGLPPWNTDEAYDTSLTPTTTAQVITQTVPSYVSVPDAEVTYYIQIQNDSINNDTYSITAASPTGAATGAGWFITYYDSITRATDITPMIIGAGGYGTPILTANGGAITMTAVIGYDSALIGPNVTKDIYIYVNSGVDLAKRDVVKCVVKTANYQPDLYSSATIGGFPGPYNNVYNANPATQAQTKIVDNGMTVTYYYKIQNDGSYSTGGLLPYSITGNDGTVGPWTITYYYDGAVTLNDLPDDGEEIDITDGWSVGNFNVGETKQLIVLISASGAARGATQNFDLYATRLETGETDTGRITVEVPSPDLWINRDNGVTWVGQDQYAPTAQVTSTLIAGSTVVTYYITLENEAALADSFSITANGSSGAGWFITYYDQAAAPGNNITGQITTPVTGWSPGSLNGGATGIMRVEVEYNAGVVPVNETKPITIYAFSIVGAPASLYDEVAGQTTSASYKPDILVKKAGEAYNFDNVYSSDSSVQNLQATVSNNQVATYYYQLQNDGTYTATSYSITGDDGNVGNWWVTYYIDPDGDDGELDGAQTSITTPGIATSAITPTGIAYLRANIYVNAFEPPGQNKIFKIYATKTDTGEVDSVQLTAQVPGTDAMVALDFDPLVTSSTWKTNNVYETAIPNSEQIVSRTIAANMVATYYIMIQNDGGALDTISVTGVSSADLGAGWWVTYYSSYDGAGDVTGQVTSAGGYPIINLAEGATSTMRCEVCYDNPVLTEQTKNIYIVTNSTTIVGSSDVVNAQILTANYKPDLLSKPAGGGYTGGDSYSSDPANLSQATNINNYQVLTYYYQLQNDGNYDSPGYTITADAGNIADKWFVTYYWGNTQVESENDANIIPAATITPTGWFSGVLNKGYSKILRVNLYVTNDSAAVAKTFKIWATKVDTGETDAGQIVATVTNSYTVDLMYQKASGGSYANTDNVYEPPATEDATQNQNIARAYPMIGTATYYIRIENEGNTDTVYTVTGIADEGSLTGSWTISCYNSTTVFNGTTDITADIAGGGWVTPSLERAALYGGASNWQDITVVTTPSMDITGNTTCTVIARVRYSDGGPADSIKLTSTMDAEYKPDAHISNGGAYTGDDVWNTDGSGANNQANTTNRNVAATYKVQVQNDGNINETFTLTGTSSATLGAGWTVSYYSDAGYLTDVTNQMVSTGHVTAVINLGAPGVPVEVLWIKVTPDDTVAGNTTVTATVTAISSNDSSEKDTVSMATTVNNAYQVDALINQSGWVGEDQYYPPTNQTASGAFTNRQTLTYYIKIQNEGNTNETITLTGVGSDSKWTISYYDNSGSGRTDISQGVITDLNYTIVLNRYGQAGSQTTDTQIWMEMTALTYTPGADIKTANIWATLQKGTANEKSDLVVAQGTVNNIYQADAMVKLEGELDAEYFRNGVPPESWGNVSYYNTVPATDQVKGKSIDNGTYATYYIRVQNDGNTDDTISISGTGTWVGPYASLDTWGTVTYYDVTGGEPGADITQAVIQGLGAAQWALVKFEGDYKLIKVIVRPYAGQSGIRNVYVQANSLGGGAVKTDAVKTINQYQNIFQPDLYVKVSSGSYVRTGPPYFSDPSPDDQFASATLNNRGVTYPSIVTYYITLKNDGSTNPDTITIRQLNTAPAGWFISYYDLASGLESEIPGTPNYSITTATGANYSINTNDTKLFRLVVSIDNSVAGTDTFTAVIKGTSSNTAYFDQVNAQTSNSVTRRPDIWLSDTITWTGDTVYETSLPGDPELLSQKQYATLMGIGSAATYYVKIENDGNYTEGISLYGYGGNANWIVSYYYDTGKDGVWDGTGSEITSQVTNAGWMPSVAPYTTGDYQQVFVVVSPNLTSLPANNSSYIAVVNLKAAGDAAKLDYGMVKTTFSAIIYQPDIMVQESGGSSYYGDNYYDSSLPITTQARSLTAYRDCAVTYYLKIQNDGTVVDSFSITGTSGDANWSIYYYVDNGTTGVYESGVDTNITSSVTGTGYAWTNVAKDDYRYLIVRVFPRWTTSYNDTKDVYIYANSTNVTTSTDVGLVTTTVTAGYQPDTWVRTSSGTYDDLCDSGQPSKDRYALPSYVIIQQSWFGVEQKKTQTITESIRTVTYYITLENDGNTADSFTLSATVNTGPDWFITYYDEGAGGVVIPNANLSNGSWSVPALPREIRAEITARNALTGTSTTIATIQSGSVNDTSKYDTVKCQVDVQVFSKPNGLVKEDGDGVYLGDSDYNTTALNQTRGPISVANSATVTYYVQVRNDGNLMESYSITAVRTTGWFVTFYDDPDGDDNNFDGTIINYTAPTFTWTTGNIGIGSSKYLRINVTPDNQYGSIPQYLYVTASSSAAVNDVVMAWTAVSNSNRPDTLLTKEGYGDTSVKETYQYNDTYYPPAWQISTTSIANNQVLTYYIWIENDGNTDETYLVTGSSASAGWWITYYEDASGTTDITTEVQNGIYNAGNPANSDKMEPYSITTWKRIIRMVVEAGNTLNGTDSATYIVKATDSTLATDTVGVTFTVNTTYKVNTSIGSISGGPYTGEAVYTPPTALDPNQAVSRTANTNKIVTYYVKIVNEANVTDTITLATAGSGSGWWITYYDPTSANITANITNPVTGWATSFTRNQAKEIRIEVTPDGSVIGTELLPITITATASGGAASTDSVLAKATAQRPDALLTKESYGDPNLKATYQYDNSYDPTSQITTTTIANNAALTYYIWLENDGNANETAYAVTGTSSYGGWIVSYYDGVSGEDDSITTAVSQGTFNPGTVGVMEPYSVTGWKRIIRMRVTATSNLSGSDTGSFIVRVTNSSNNTDTVQVNATVATTYQVNTAVKTESAPYVGETKYTPPDALDPDQTVTNTVSTNSILTYYFKVVNEANVTDTISVTGIGNSAGWWVSYYMVPGGADITANITNPATGWATSFTRNEIKEVKILVQPDNTPDGGNTKAISVTAWSTLSGFSKYDSVLAKAIIVTTRRPDLLISLDNSVFSGDGDYEDEIPPISANQTKQGSAKNNEVITYYVKLQNDGNLGETFTISATLPGSGWFITFYDNTDTQRLLPWETTGAITKTDSITVKFLVMPIGKNNGDSGDLIIYAKSTADTASVDAVDAKTTVSASDILYPQDYKQVGPTPVFMGLAAPSVTVELWDITGGLPGTQVLTTTSDANGYWMMKVTGALSVGGHIFKPIAGGVEGQPRPITVEAVAPATVPSIISPVENEYIVTTNRPDISGNAGVTNAGQAITATVNINTTATLLYDMNIGTAFVQADGSYTINLTQPLPRGTRQIALICNGVVSDLRTIILVDPIGILFDEQTNQPLDGMEVSLWRSTTDGTFTWVLCPVGGLPGEIGGPVGVTNPQTSGWTGVTGQYQFLLNQPAVGVAYNYKIIVTNSSGYTFPASLPAYQTATSTIIGSAGTASIPAFINLFPGDPVTRTIYVDDTTFLGVAPSVARNLSVGGYFEMDNSELDLIYADIPLAPTATLLRITKASNKPDVSIGDILTYEIKIVNSNASPVKNVYIRDIMPAGFKYIDGSTMIDNTTKLADPTGGRTRIFNVGTINANSTKIIRYQLVVGTAVTFGEYKNTAQAEYVGGMVISNKAQVKVRVIPDPVFDYATIIGKVFNDYNGDGVQDENEPGVGRVKIMTEDGIVVETDQHGKYHLAGLKPKTKLLKVDENSLPIGAEFSTPNPVLVRFTLGGHLEKVNFGLKLAQSAESLERRIVRVNIKVVTTPEGNPQISVAGQQVRMMFPPKSEGRTERRVRVQVGYTMLPLDENGNYNGDYTLPPGETTLKIWAENRWGYEKEERHSVSLPSLEVKVYREDDRPALTPELGLVVAPEILNIKGGRLAESARFKILTNYSQFITKWKLVIYEPVRGGAWIPEEDDKENLVASRENGVKSDTLIAGEFGDATPPAGYQVFYEKTGTSADIEKDIVWEGRSSIDRNRMVEQDKAYKYKLIVEGKDGNVDMTKDGQLIVVSFWAEKLRKTFKIEAPLVGGVKPVPAIGPTPVANINTSGKVYSISGKTDPKNKIAISTPGSKAAGFEVEPFEDGTFETEVYVSATEGRMLIEAITPDKQRRVQMSENIKAPEKRQEGYLVLNGLIDTQFGSNSTSGVLDATRNDKTMRDGAYGTGRASLFLKARLGEYQLTSSFDSQREEKDLFKFIDPDKFYPLYGDDSVRTDVADNTQGMFYVRVEREQSSAMWGNYSTGFSGTELAQYNRGFYGAKIQLAKPFFSTTKATLFVAEAKQLASHNEIRATGGSLYYLKDRYLMDGSEKITVEVRDKVNGMTISSTVMNAGADYEIDYKNGRILFYHPIASVSTSNTIISTELLDGNPVYIIVDYEYDASRHSTRNATGLRVTQPVGKNIDLGATYVTEEKPLEDYSLMGTDVKFRFAPYGDIGFEYASSESESTPGFISYDGGFDFATLPTAQTADGAAYKLNLNFDLGLAFTKVPNEVMFAGYFQNIEKGFSSGQSVFQQGTTKFGFTTSAKLTQRDNLLVRFDGQQLDENGNTASATQVGADSSQSLNIQVTHDQAPLKLTGSYQYQTTDKPIYSSLLRDEGSQILAARADYQVNKEWTLSVEQQGVLAGKPNNQTTLGGVLKLTEKERMDISTTMGTLGNSVQAGITSQVSDKHALYTKYQVSEDKAGNKSYSTIFGERKQVSKDVGIYREERFTGRNSAEDTQYTGLMGLDYVLNQYWSMGANYERSQVDNVHGTLTSRDVASVGLAYNSHPREKDPSELKGYMRFNTRLEYRMDKGAPDRTSILTANKLYYQFNGDASSIVKMNYSKTNNDTTGDVEAEFTEVSLGLAYRPINNDKYNLLTKVTYQSDRTPRNLEPMVSNLESAMILSLEGAVDLNAKMQVLGKLAYKQATEETGNHGSLTSSTYLIAPRFNYKIESDSEIINNWIVGVEYRMLVAQLAKDQKAGFVLEFEKELTKYHSPVGPMGVNLGFGYNFTDFTDDLSVYDDDYNVSGFFIRLSTKF
ncbi:MAG: right-handed parallel beta-helix repeat-containing protein [Planctomycetes bacterium]|nr:right-handed parallel beta-helix repeat-containing protein [Planctomycetota bacterium]